MAEGKSTESLVPFWRISDLAVQIAKKYDIYVNAGVSYIAFRQSRDGKEYNYYDARMSTGTIKFRTVTDLIQHMQKILNPPIDKGVAV